MSLTVSAWYLLKAAGVFAATMTIAAARRDQHPYPQFGPANQVTTVRALLVALVAGFIGEADAPPTAMLTVACGAAAATLDAADGWLARRTKMTSAFGARFDMEMDALLILALAILVWLRGKAGTWVLASGLLRYLFVVAGWVWSWMRAPLPPSIRRRIVCAVQIIALLVALWPLVSPNVSVAAATLGLGALSYSFLVDTMWLWERRFVPSGVEG